MFQKFWVVLLAIVVLWGSNIDSPQIDALIERPDLKQANIRYVQLVKLYWIADEERDAGHFRSRGKRVEFIRVQAEILRYIREEIAFDIDQSNELSD